MRFTLQRATARADTAAGPVPVTCGIDGRTDLPERELPHLAGYLGSKPVRIGNAAAAASSSSTWTRSGSSIPPALGCWSGGLRRVRAQDGSLDLICTQQPILKIFRVTGLIELFGIYETVDQAIAATKGPLVRNAPPGPTPAPSTPQS